MGYLHIDNLYKNQNILLFRECFALEKIHGTSAHLAWSPTGLQLFSGGVNHKAFASIFDETSLTAAFTQTGHTDITVYGEAYGGSCQGMKATYGNMLNFIVFDIKVRDCWLSVPDMVQVAGNLGLEVVPLTKVSTDVAVLDAERDKPSEVAVRRGITEPRLREGIVLRPLIEVTTNNGNRIIAKHKGTAFEERTTPQKVVDPTKLAVLAEADAIAQEWVTPMRLEHVLQRIQNASVEQTPEVIRAMIEDVYREAKSEIVESKDASRAIGKRAARLFHERLKGDIQ